MKGLRAATTFLTRLPVGAESAETSNIARSIPWFPVVGALLGATLAGVYVVVRLVLTPLLAASVAVGAGVVATGALHEDGLADSADALGGRSREEALGILKDPAHGTYGVLAIALSLVLRVAALSTLGRWSAVAVLPATHALSRGASIGLLRTLRPATEEGLGRAHAAAVSGAGVAVALSAAFLLGFASLGLWVIPAAALATLGSLGISLIAMRTIGGLTGDVLGAAEQVTEILILLLAAAAVTQGWPSLAWWR